LSSKTHAKKKKGCTHKLVGSLELEPKSHAKHIQKRTNGLKKKKGEHTQKNKRLPGEISHDLLPTYLFWYENQGDVVPLNRGKETTN
jgi:hypothetical protein